LHDGRRSVRIAALGRFAMRRSLVLAVLFGVGSSSSPKGAERLDAGRRAGSNHRLDRDRVLGLLQTAHLDAGMSDRGDAGFELLRELQKLHEQLERAPEVVPIPPAPRDNRPVGPI
jgi:hypothetical protein